MAKGNDEQFVKDWLWRVKEEELKEMFIWSFVRNPYDRFISAASMFQFDPNLFARHFNEVRAENRMVKRHTEPQHTFTHYCGHQVPDFIGRFENIEEDWRTVLERIDLPYKELTKSNKSRHGHWSEVLTKETKSFVASFYHYDFEYFGYEK
jgi:hypothetical protein